MHVRAHVHIYTYSSVMVITRKYHNPDQSASGTIPLLGAGYTPIATSPRNPANNLLLVLRLGTDGHALHCPLYHSRTAFWTVLTSLTGNKGYLGESERL